MLAAAHTQPEMVELLRARGSNLEAVDKYGRTATVIAAEVGDPSVFTLLFDGSLDDGVVFAAEGGYGILARQIIGKGASVDARQDGRTALMIAAELGQEGVLGILLELAADLEAVSGAGETALMRASRKNQAACASLLLDSGADIHTAIDSSRFISEKHLAENDGTTALMIAAKLGHDSIVRLLVERKSDVEAVDSNRETPLMHAARFDQDMIVKTLFENGASLEAENKWGETAVYIAAKCAKSTVTRTLVAQNKAQRRFWGMTRRSPSPQRRSASPVHAAP
jgi:ankyrin repeat protein